MSFMPKAYLTDEERAEAKRRAGRSETVKHHDGWQPALPDVIEYLTRLVTEEKTQYAERVQGERLQDGGEKRMMLMRRIKLAEAALAAVTGERARGLAAKPARQARAQRGADQDGFDGETLVSVDGAPARVVDDFVWRRVMESPLYQPA